jgi:hypothetical protein
LAIGRELPKAWPFPSAQRSQNWTPDVRKHEALDLAPSGDPSNHLHVQVPTDTTREPDGTTPGGSFREHHIRSASPGWEYEKLWRPDNRAASGSDAVPAGRMTGMDDGVIFDG